MNTPKKVSSPEREQTDESLRTEREKTDEALRGEKKRVENEADLIVSRARDTADAVLSTAREKADDALIGSSSGISDDTMIKESRALEDEVIRSEREAADATITKERREVDQALRRLLPFEREATDRTLITERARSDSALESRDNFLEMVCHDLRDLLGGIVMNTELLTLETAASLESERVTLSAAQIQRYAARMNRLIGDLVDVASIDAGKLSIAPVRADTTQLVVEAIETFKLAAHAKNISLEVDTALASEFAHFDHDRILQVFANLISNAIKFSSAGGTITLGREKTASELKFSIIDTGTGIPDTMLDAVFDRFWQVGKNDRRGLGLGLYISKCIVEAHSGKIWVESAIRKGSSFYFTLPLPRQ